MKIRIGRAKRIEGTIRVPSDKSITHRALIFAALAKSSSEIKCPLIAGDTLETLKCLMRLGTSISKTEDGTFRVSPIEEWGSPDIPLYCGNSGTTIRLLAGVIASRPIHVELTGDDSLNNRPMGRIRDPLMKMGAHIDEEYPPLSIQGNNLKGIDYVSPIASAQIKSAVFLAALNAEGTTRYMEPHPSRDHTERILQSLGVNFEKDGRAFAIEGKQQWDGFTGEVPGDFSSAANWMIAAAILPGSELRLQHVGLNPTRIGLLHVFKKCGVHFEVKLEGESLGEPFGEIVVRGDRLKDAFDITSAEVPVLIDEIPLLALLATQCHGSSRILGLSELKVKESDRLAAIVENLRRMGAKVEYLKDGLAIHGPCVLREAEIVVNQDHRIAMAFAIAGLVAKGTTVIDHAEYISTSYPQFTEHLKQLAKF